MQIGIASTHSPRHDGTVTSVDRRFGEAAEARGAAVTFVDPLRCSYELHDGHLSVVHSGAPLRLDGLLVRRAAHHWNAMKTLVLVAHELGATCLDGPETFIGSLSGKFQALLRRYRMPEAYTPRSFLYFHQDALDGHPPPNSAYPLLRKPLRGSLGEGIVLLTDAAALARYVADYDFAEPLMLQQRVAGTEYRALLLGSRCLGVVAKRPGPAGLGNAARGALFERAAPAIGAAIADLGARVMETAPYEFAALDLFHDEARSAYWILECNRNPHFAAFERALPDVDVAGQVMDHLIGRIHAGDSA